MYMYCIERSVKTSVLQESQGLTTYAFVMLLLAMISLHMLTFKLMVTMVAEFRSLVILTHNTLVGKIRSIVHELQGKLLVSGSETTESCQWTDFSIYYWGECSEPLLAKSMPILFLCMYATVDCASAHVSPRNAQT